MAIFFAPPHPTYWMRREKPPRPRDRGEVSRSSSRGENESQGGIHEQHEGAGVPSGTCGGLLAIFIALSGTAIAADDGPTASSSAVTTAKFKKLKQRVAALETKLNSPVSGDLTGTFPNLQIAANAVGTNEIAANAVTTAKIADDAVTNAKIANDAVNAAEIAADAVGSSEIAAGAVGASEIAAGAVGGSELANIDIVEGLSTPVASNASASAGNGRCGGGQLVSGGVVWDTTDEDVGESSQFNFLNAWFVRGTNNDAVLHNFTPIGYCIP